MKNIVDLSVGVAGHGGDFGASGGDWDKMTESRNCTPQIGTIALPGASACGNLGIGGTANIIGTAEAKYACCITDGSRGEYPIGSWAKEADGIVDGTTESYTSLSAGQVNFCVPAPCGRAWSQLGYSSGPTDLLGPSGTPISGDLCNKLANVPMAKEDDTERWVPQQKGAIPRRGWSRADQGILNWARSRNWGEADKAATKKILDAAIAGSVFVTSDFTLSEVDNLKDIAYSVYGQEGKWLSLYDHCACAPIKETDATGVREAGGTDAQNEMKVLAPAETGACRDITGVDNENATAVYNINLRREQLWKEK